MIEPVDLIAALLEEHGFIPYKGASTTDAHGNMRIHVGSFEKTFGVLPVIYHRWVDARVILYGFPVRNQNAKYNLRMELMRFNDHNATEVKYFSLYNPDSIDEILKWVENCPVPESIKYK